MNAVASPAPAIRAPMTPTCERFAQLAPRPKRLEDTGISITQLTELAIKHLLESGALSLAELATRLALTGGIVEQILALLRKEALVQIVSTSDASSGLRFELTQRGRASGADARYRNSYTGPAPIPLAQYQALVDAQSVHALSIDREGLRNAMSDLVIRDTLLDQIGPALNSGRAIFIYGLAGTGKTYITRRLARVLGDEVLIPYAVDINGTAIAVFDPILHRPLDDASGPPELRLDQGFDPRFVRCQRPVVVTGGELTLEMLDLHFDPATRAYTAPLQLKANNGLFIIDDLGRQRIAPEAIFNRWIVPMEEQTDYLSLGSGRQFGVPFDVVLVFSTNRNPADLADAAFLRRIGYKIEFGPLTPDEYRHIWEDVCREFGIECERTLDDFAITELHDREHIPLLACHPRDLLRMALDLALYRSGARRIERDHLLAAWRNYFVSTGSETANSAATPIQGGI